MDTAYYWRKAARDIEGRVRGCLFGNLALEISTREDMPRAKLIAVFNKTKERFRETLEEAVATGAMAPLDTDSTATAMLAYLEGIILLAKTQNDPEVVRIPRPAIKSLRIESMN